MNPKVKKVQMSSRLTKPTAMHLFNLSQYIIVGYIKYSDFFLNNPRKDSISEMFIQNSSSAKKLETSNSLLFLLLGR